MAQEASIRMKALRPADVCSVNPGNLPDLQATSLTSFFFFFFFLKIVFIFFRERKGGRKRWRETSMCGCLSSHVPRTGDVAGILGMCPDWELNQRPFGLQAGAQSTEPHQPGLTSSVVETKWVSQRQTGSSAAPRVGLTEQTHTLVLVGKQQNTHSFTQ